MAVAEATRDKVLFEIVKLATNRTRHPLGLMTEALRISMPVSVERAVETVPNTAAAIAPGDCRGAAH